MKFHRTLPEPNACFWCDLPKDGHARQQWGGGGSHVWTPPTDAMRLERMKARRTARQAARAATKTFRYHAAANWTGDSTDGEGDMYCSDCPTHCHQFWRIQHRLDRALRRAARLAGEAQGDGWGQKVPF